MRRAVKGERANPDPLLDLPHPLKLANGSAGQGEEDRDDRAIGDVRD
jgi:hypothetical protein